MIFDLTSLKLKIRLIIEYWLWASKGNKNDINTRSTIVSILSESHQDLGATETFFWTCHFPLWCNSCCGDPRIVYKCCLQDGNVVAKDSCVDTTNRSCLVNVNKDSVPDVCEIHGGVTHVDCGFTWVSQNTSFGLYMVLRQ